MKIAIYTRVSTSMQFEDGHSLESQRRILLDYCLLKGWSIHKLYTDEGISGKNTNRSGFQTMISDAKSKNFDAILVWKLSRFSRSLKDLVVTIDDLKKYDVTLISYSENIDLSTATGKLMFNIVGSFAEFERETISENIKMSISQAVYKGRRNISHCFGYRVVNKEMIIHDTEAAIINELYDYYIGCHSVAKTLKHAQRSGYVGRRGAELKFTSIQVMLRNVAYVGYSTYKGFIPYKHRIIPQIVPDDKFDTVQTILKQNCPTFAAKGQVKTINEWLSTLPGTKK